MRGVQRLALMGLCLAGCFQLPPPRQALSTHSDAAPSNDADGGDRDGLGSSDAPHHAGGGDCVLEREDRCLWVLQLAAGGDHTCALMSDRTVRCWGAQTFGQLGNGHREDVPQPAPVAVEGLAEAKALVAAFHHTCALDAHGSIWCWGRNHRGQLGLGDRADRTAPERLSLEDVEEINALRDTTCARKTDGSVWCWGLLHHGLGYIDATDDDSHPLPQRVSWLDDEEVERLAIGCHHSCVIVKGGEGVQCWGDNAFGQLGTGTAAEGPVPAAAVIAGPVSELGAGCDFACAVRSGVVSCWGVNEKGVAGAPFSALESAPHEIVGGFDASVLRVEGGWGHACALQQDRRVRCWGANNNEALGVSGLDASYVPLLVPGLGDVAQLAVGWGHACALRDDGAVVCWGRNVYGQIGAGTVGASAAPTVAVWR